MPIMLTTVDIRPMALYRELKSKAASRKALRKGTHFGAIEVDTPFRAQKAVSRQLNFSSCFLPKSPAPCNSTNAKNLLTYFISLISTFGSALLLSAPYSLSLRRSWFEQRDDHSHASAFAASLTWTLAAADYPAVVGGDEVLRQSELGYLRPLDCNTAYSLWINPPLSQRLSGPSPKERLPLVFGATRFSTPSPNKPPALLVVTFDQASASERHERLFSQ